MSLPPGEPKKEREKTPAAAAARRPFVCRHAAACLGLRAERAADPSSRLRLPLPHNGAMTPSNGRRRRPPPRPRNVLGFGIPQPPPPRFVSSGSPAPGSPPSPASDPRTPRRTSTSTPLPPPPPPREANTQEGQHRLLISLPTGTLPNGGPRPSCPAPRPGRRRAPPLRDSAARGGGAACPPACRSGGVPPLLPTWCGRRLPWMLGRCEARSPSPRFSPFLCPPPTPAPGKFLIYFFKPSIRKSCGEEPSPALLYIFIGRSVPSSVCHTGRQRATLLING